MRTILAESDEVVSVRRMDGQADLEAFGFDRWIYRIVRDQSRLRKSRSPEGAAWLAEKMTGAGAHLMGRKAFCEMASFWPTATGKMAAFMNEVPKIVFTKKRLFASGRGAGRKLGNGNSAFARSERGGFGTQISAWTGFDRPWRRRVRPKFSRDWSGRRVLAGDSSGCHRRRRRAFPETEWPALPDSRREPRV